MTTTAQGEGNTLEGNRIIAEFMGLQLDEAGFIKVNPTTIKIKVDHDLQFNTSWDWLMPVVEKIRDLGHTSHIKSVIGGTNEISIFIGVGVKPIGIYEWNNKKPMIRCVYESVIEFIKWYNSNPQTPK